MKVIFKYPLYAPINTLELPKGAIVRHVHGQRGDTMIWVEGEHGATATELRTFILVGTGNQFNTYEAGRYLGTAHVDPFVWHVYEVVA